LLIKILDFSQPYKNPLIINALKTIARATKKKASSYQQKYRVFTKTSTRLVAPPRQGKFVHYVLSPNESDEFLT